MQKAGGTGKCTRLNRIRLIALGPTASAEISAALFKETIIASGVCTFDFFHMHAIIAELNERVRVYRFVELSMKYSKSPRIPMIPSRWILFARSIREFRTHSDLHRPRRSVCE